MIEGVGNDVKKIVKTASLKVQLNSLKSVFKDIKKKFNTIKNKK